MFLAQADIFIKDARAESKDSNMKSHCAVEVSNWD